MSCLPCTKNITKPLGSTSLFFDQIKKVEVKKQVLSSDNGIFDELELLNQNNQNSIKDYREAIMKIKKEKRNEREMNQIQNPDDITRIELRKQLAEKLKYKNN